MWLKINDERDQFIDKLMKLAWKRMRKEISFEIGTMIQKWKGYDTFYVITMMNFPCKVWGQVAMSRAMTCCYVNTYDEWENHASKLWQRKHKNREK